jgi:hypothetical protein
VAAAELNWDDKRRRTELETVDTLLRVPGEKIN